MQLELRVIKWGKAEERNRWLMRGEKFNTDEMYSVKVDYIGCLPRMSD